MGKNNSVTSVTVDMGEPVTINGLQINSNGTISFEKDGQTIVPQSAYLTQSKPRENNNDKITLNAPIKEVSNLTINLLDLIGKLDHLFIIDTNTPEQIVKEDGKKTSACAIQHYQVIEDELLFINQFGQIFDHDSNIHGEKIAIAKLISYILFDLKIEPNKLIGIVTDHDLGNHEKYNAREIPLINGMDLYLPEHISFIYASADKKNENFLTQLINECDKRATELLKSRK